MSYLVTPEQYDEVTDSPRIRIGEDGRVVGERTFRLHDWNSWPDFVTDLRGLIGLSGNGDPAILQPRMFFPGYENLQVSDIDISPWDGQSPQGDQDDPEAETNVYASGARFVVQYRILDANDEHQPHAPAGTWLEWDMDAGVDPIEIPGAAWTYDATAAPYDGSAAVQIPIYVAQHVIRWYNVPKPPYTAIRALINKISASPFMGIPAGCLRFDAWSKQIVPQLNTAPGQDQPRPKYNITYRFAERCITRIATPDTSTPDVVGFNWSYSAEGDGAGEHWFEIVNKNSGEKPFATGDLARLFVFGTKDE